MFGLGGIILLNQTPEILCGLKMSLFHQQIEWKIGETKRKMDGPSL